MSINPDLVKRGIELKRDRDNNQLEWGRWAIECCEKGKHGPQGLKAHLEQVHVETGEESPAIKTVQIWRLVAVAWDEKFIPINFSVPWSVLVILKDQPDRYELIKTIKTKQQALDYVREISLQNATDKAILNIEKREQAKLQKIQDQVAKKQAELEILLQKEAAFKPKTEAACTKEAEKVAQQEVDVTFQAIIGSLESAEESQEKDIDTTVKDVIKQGAHKAAQKIVAMENRTSYSFTKWVEDGIEARSRLIKQGMDDVGSDKMFEMENWLDSMEKTAIAYREYFNERKMKKGN